MKIEGYNQEHYDKLKEGVESCNEWREENPTIQPLLRGADLERAQLHSADLREANNLTVGQLCKAETLYRAKLGVELKKQTKEKCPSKLTNKVNVR